MVLKKLIIDSKSQLDAMVKDDVVVKGTEIAPEVILGGETEIDYMEYPTNVLAQEAYVSSSIVDIFSITPETYGTFTNRAARTLIPSTALNNNAEVVKVTFKSRTDVALKVTKAYIGHQASSGDPYDFDGNQTELKFSGTSGFNIEADATIISDGTVFSLDSSKNLIVSFDVNDPGGVAIHVTGNSAYSTYYKIATAEAEITDVTGYSDYDTWVTGVTKIEGVNLQCYSESTIVEQGDHSLKIVAQQTGSLNETLTRTVDPPIDLSDQNTVKFGAYALRTGTNFEVKIRDSGGVWTTLKQVNILTNNEWQTEECDISGVSNINKDAIDRIQIKIIEASADNTFYLDGLGTPFALLGALTSLSEKIDAITLGMLRWVEELLAGTDITFATRTGPTETPDAGWSNWSGELTNPVGSQMVSPADVYIQFRATLTTTDTSKTPRLYKTDYVIELNYESILLLSKVTLQKGIPEQDGIRAIYERGVFFKQYEKEVLAQFITTILYKKDVLQKTALIVEALKGITEQGIRDNESSFQMPLKTNLRVVESLSVSQALIISYPIPPTITGLVAIDLKSGDAIRLYWDAIADSSVVGYNIYRAEAETGPFVKVYTTIHNEYIDGGLTLNKPYWFKVRGVNRQGIEGAD